MAQKKVKIKSIKWMYAISGFLVIIGAFTILWFIIPSCLSGYLSEYVKKRSGGTYTLTIEKIESELFPFSFNFNNVKLIPYKPAFRQKGNSEKALYTFSAARIRLENISRNLFFKEIKFNCDLVKIKQPSFKLEGRELIGTDSLQITSEIISKIKPLLKSAGEITIKKIELEEADFSFYSAIGDSNLISHATRVSVDIMGFHTGKSMISNETDFFKTDDVVIRMNDFKNDMGDSLHVLTIDTLAYSLKTSGIRAWGFKLNPLYSSTKKNLFEVYVPEVFLKSRSLTRFTMKDSLSIRFLEFKNPVIKFFRKEIYNQLNIEDINNFDLYTLVCNQFTKMVVDTFLLTGANLEIYKQPELNEYQQQFKSIDIELRGFELDSTSAVDLNKMFHADNLEMQVDGYYLRLEDNHHSFRADSLFVSTFSNQLFVRKIDIQPITPGNSTTRTEVNIECDEVNIENADFLSLYHKRILPVSKIEITKPDVHLQYHLDLKKTKEMNDAGLLFELVTDYLLGVYSNLVYIEKGKLNIQNRYDKKVQGYFETDFDFSLTDFTLDSASVKRTDKFFYATALDMLFSNYQLKLIDNLHKIDIKKIAISSLNQNVQIENLKLSPVAENINYETIQKYNRSELFNISVPLINLDGIDLRNAFFHKKLKISQFNISRPLIYFENFGTLRAAKGKIELTEFWQLLFNYIEDFDIDSFSVANGKLTWINHTGKGKTISFDNEFSASLNRFRLNNKELEKQRLLFSDNFNLTINDQQFELSDGVHVLKTGKINISSAESRLTVSDAHLYPLITSDNYEQLPVKFKIAIPQIKISDFDFQKAYYLHKPEFDKLELVTPGIEVFIEKQGRKFLDLNKYKIPFPKIIDSLRLGELKLTGGKVITYESRGIKNKASANFRFDLSMPSVVIKNNRNNNAGISSNNILLNIYDFRIPLKKKHNFSIEELRYNRDKQGIEFTGLKVEPFMPSEKENHFNIYLPEIKFNEFDLPAAIDDNHFNFNTITVNNPDIDIKINQELKGDTLKFIQTLDLYPFIETLTEQIKINNLSFNNLKLNFNWLRKQLFDNNFNLNFKDILISKNKSPSNLLNSGEFEISTTNLVKQSKDGRYTFTADSMVYNSTGHDLLLINLGINPAMEKGKSPNTDGYQTDIVNTEISYVTLRDIDEKKWLQDNILVAGLLELGPSVLKIYRNKRYPLNPDQRPPWPQDLLKQTDQHFLFDSVLLRPSCLIYSELMSIHDEPGYVKFEDMTLNGGGLSNIPEIIQDNSHFIINANTRLFNHAMLSARINFDLSAPGYKHTIEGSLEPMKLEPINVMLTKAEPISVENGYLNLLDFKISADENSSVLFMNINYEDLKIAIHEYNSPVLQKARFASFWANNFVLNSKYPKGNRPDTVSVTYDRDSRRSIINYWWKTLFSGIKEALGLQDN